MYLNVSWVAGFKKCVVCGISIVMEKMDVHLLRVRERFLVPFPEQRVLEEIIWLSDVM